MRPLKVLLVAHGHPEIYVGGAEVFAYELFRGVRALDGVDAVFLARTFDDGYSGPRSTPFRAHRDREDEILWYAGHYDELFQTLIHKEEYTVAFRELLENFKPHVVHVQHTSGLGLGLLREIRRVVPDAALVYTLHEFLPICHAAGLMVRTDGELCDRAEPARCHRCFPKVLPSWFLLRERMVKTELAHVDRFVAPSEFLRRRFVEWGLPEQKIVFEEYGRMPLAPLADPPEGPPIGHFAFLGQLAPHKGLLLLLEAMLRLRQEGVRDVRLFVHGSNLERQSEDFQRRFYELVAACGDLVTLRGRYRTAEIPERLRDVAWVVVPSVWWENSPLVIQEAFALRRPVVCSALGGMAEKVRDGVDGLHFRPGDPASLAATLRRAAGSPELWRRLQAGIPAVHSMEATIAFHVDLYRSLLETRSRVPV